MRRTIMISLMLVLVAALIAVPVMAGKFSDCTRIQDGVLTYSASHYLAGQPLETGYDIFGYNYHAHLFNGSYANAYLGGYGYPPYEGDSESYLADNPGAAGLWVWPYRDVWLNMKWNDAWLSNKDCNIDGVLDRPYPYIGSGAWCTNHQRGEDWVYFVKIVAAPGDAYVVDYGDYAIWYTADGTEIGEEIWGAFAIIQQVESGEGATYVSPSGPGLGNW
jgi:hypothetical protein